MSLAVLVVEDDPDDQRIVRKYLEKLGYTVPVMVATGAEAVCVAEGKRLDIALVDVNAGGGSSGLEAAEILSDRFGLPVVLTSDRADATELDRAKGMGALGFVVKPYLQQQLSTAIEMALSLHRMERALERQRSWFHSVLSVLGESVIVTDPEGRITFVNRAATRALGVEAGDALEQSVHAIFRPLPDGDGAPVENPIDVVLRTGAPDPDRTMRVQVGESTLLVEASGRPVEDALPGRRGAVLVFRDVAERERANEALRLAAKMQSASSLASGVAHQFNNALQIVLGHAELIASLAPHDGQIHRSALEIARAGQSSTELVGQLLSFSRDDRTEPEPVHLSDLLAELGGLARTMLPTTITIRMPENVPAAVIHVRKREMRSALVHLVENARDAMPHGGTLTLAGARRDTNGQGGRGQVVISISDTGEGIRPELRPRLFEPFFSPRGPGGGSGLGLASALRTAQLHGGSVELDGEPSGGTIFRVVIPESTIPLAATALEPPAPAREGGPPGGTETVLVVEDEENVSSLLQTALEGLGYTVLTANGADAALLLLEERRDEIALVLTDIIMPRVNGVELARRVQAKLPGCRVMLMSAYGAKDAVGFYLPGEPPRVHLEKPFHIDQLARAVRRALSDP